AFSVAHVVYPALFLDETGMPVERSVLDVLRHFGYRRLEASPAEFNLKLLRAERAAGEAGLVVAVRVARPGHAGTAPAGDRRAGAGGHGGESPLLLALRPVGRGRQPPAVRARLQPR